MEPIPRFLRTSRSQGFLLIEKTPDTMGLHEEEEETVKTYKGREVLPNTSETPVDIGRGNKSVLLVQGYEHLPVSENLQATRTQIRCLSNLLPGRKDTWFTAPGEKDTTRGSQF